MKDNYYIKISRTNKRFESEVNYYSFFKKNNFKLPNRVDISKENLSITYEYISGRIPDANNIKNIFNIISRVCSLSQSSQSPHSFSQNLDLYIKSTQKVLSFYQLDFFCNQVKKNIEKSFYPSIFKDSKPENWIVKNKNEIYMIDFDYVVMSSQIQDFAQFLTGIWINEAIKDKSFFSHWFELFIKNNDLYSLLRLNEKNRQQLYLVACLISTYKKRQYIINKNKENKILSLEKTLIDYF